MDCADMEYLNVWGEVWGERESLAVQKLQGIEIIGGR